MIYWYHFGVLDQHFMLEWPWLGRNGFLYYSTYWCYIHQTYTNCSSWHDLLMSHGTFCPHAGVTMVRNGKEETIRSLLQYLMVLHSPNSHQLFILTCSTCVTQWFVSLTYISHSEWTWLGRNGSVYNTMPMSATFTKLTPTVHLDIIYWCHVVVCVLDLHFTVEWPRHKIAIAFHSQQYLVSTILP